jgi:hypothetical protein
MDLKKVFTQRSTFNYVLVIEWLEHDDRRTGAMLVEHLLKSGVNSAIAVCDSAEQFRAILRVARERIPQLGIPAIHIETHGAEPPEDLEADVAFGAGDGPLLTWSELGMLLAPLNQAANFQLMLVGAACYGAAAMGTMNAASHVAPFSVCLGYETKVLDTSIIKSMTELYSGLLVRREDPHAAISKAQNLLNPGEKIHFLTSVILAYQVFRWCFQDLTEKFEDIPASLRRDYKKRMFEAWEQWFPSELQERDETYKLEWNAVIAPQPTDDQLANALNRFGAAGSAQNRRFRSALRIRQT